MSQRTHANLIRQYDDVYLACRDLRHVWQLVGFYRGDAGEVRRLLDCERCGTQRIDRWRLSGEREPSSYSYANEYQMREGFQSWEVRREVLKRATIYKSQTDMIDTLTRGGKPKVRRGDSAA